ncbi:MAG: DUF3109 family protein [Bacteroidetes bacterium]|nr:DUF3109 family protein [Bacteroidota bacterium]
MIQHRNTLISEYVLDKEFICNLDACKGACCIEGEWGAPLERSEIDIIANELDTIKPFMNGEALAFLAENGFSEEDPDGDLVTTCLPSGACVFAISENGQHKCAIEKAHLAGKTTFKKPISCHLYPIRLLEMRDITALNYHKWSICSAACALGARHKVPLFMFLKDALIRRFGQEWYSELEEIAEQYANLK